MSRDRQYMADYMRKRYHERKREAFKILGGQCKKCGSKKGLHIDHRDRAKKAMSVNRMTMVSRAKFLSELKKCQLLCSGCHMEKSIKELGNKPAKGTHGTLSSYRYCRCSKCRKAMSDYNRARHQASVAKSGKASDS